MIIYFSGTGNSLKIAQELAHKLGDSAVHINQALKLEKHTYKRIGLVYPVYNYDMPRLMQDFVSEFDFTNVEYIYGIISHGGDKGNALFTLNELLSAQEQKLSYVNDILSPVNSRIMYGMVTDKIEERLNKGLEKLAGIADDILNQINNASELKQKKRFAIINNLVEKPFVKRMFTPVVDSELCVACGICKDVCPAYNISINDGKAFIEDNCVNCITCVHWCPEVAIHFGKRRVQKKQQYHHPEVKLKEVLAQF